MNARMIHGGGDSHRSGIKIRGLLKFVITALEHFLQFHHIFIRTAGVAGNKIRYNVLFFSCSTGKLLEFLDKF